MPKSLATRIVLWMVGDVPISRRFNTNANHEPAHNIPVNFVKPQSFVEVQPMSYFLLRGLHDRICSIPTCWRPKQWDDCDCSCRFCGGRINGKFHVMECTSFEGVPWQTLAEATKDQITRPWPVSYQDWWAASPPVRHLGNPSLLKIVSGEK